MVFEQAVITQYSFCPAILYLTCTQVNPVGPTIQFAIQLHQLVGLKSFLFNFLTLFSCLHVIYMPPIPIYIYRLHVFWLECPGGMIPWPCLLFWWVGYRWHKPVDLYSPPSYGLQTIELFYQVAFNRVPISFASNLHRVWILFQAEYNWVKERERMALPCMQVALFYCLVHTMWGPAFHWNFNL